MDKLMFIYPFYIIMFEENLSSISQIATLLVIWKISTFVLEYPSGILADTYSRKTQLIIAQLIMALGFVTWILYKTFPAFALGFVFWGISASLKSGTFEAFMFDKMKDLGLQDRFKKSYARSKSFQYLGILIAGGLSTFVFSIGSYDLVLSLSIAALIFSIVPLLAIKESKSYKSTGEKAEFGLFKQSLLEIKGNQLLLALVLIIVIVEAVGLPIEEYTNILEVESGLKKEMLGIFGLLLQGATLIGTEIAGRLNKIPNKLNILILLIDGLIWLVSAHLMNTVSLVLIIVDSFLIAIFFVTFEDDFQRLIPSNIRASVSSLKAFFSRLVASIFFIGFGLFADKYSIQGGYYFLVAIMITYAVFIFVYLRKKQLLD